jgi:hypothetical protein
MKRKWNVFLGFAVLLIAAIFTFTGCPTDGGDPEVTSTIYILSDDSQLEIRSDGTAVLTKSDGETKINGTVSGGTVTLENEDTLTVDEDGRVEGEVDGYTVTGEKDEYELLWGIWDGASYSQISVQFTSNGFALTSAGSNAGYLTGSSATNALNTIQNTPGAEFDDDGEVAGTFEKVLDYTKDGRGLPDNLKTTLKAQRTSAPLAVVFQLSHDDGSTSVVAFYVTKVSN